MYTLSNFDLSVQILDPIPDVAHEGSRYCTGGYIWQIISPAKGPLLAGPEWPSATPNTFDGQGAPDMFFTPLGAEDAAVGDQVGVIGVGNVLRTSSAEPFYVAYNRTVARFVEWRVQATLTHLKMTTSHTFKDWAYNLSREVWLQGKTVHSRTTIQSTGEAVLPVKWFAHPFFPIPSGERLSRFDPAVTIGDNPGFDMDEEGWITRKPEHDWERGQYQALTLPETTQPISVEQRHPQFNKVVIKTDWAPTFLPIWGNAHTYSFEPYYIRDLSKSEEAAWTISYAWA